MDLTQFCVCDLFGMVSLRDPNSKVVVDLQRSGDQKGHDLNHLKECCCKILLICFPIGSMGLVYLPTWLVDFYGFQVGKYTVCPMDPMGLETLQEIRETAWENLSFWTELVSQKRYPSKKIHPWLKSPRKTNGWNPTNYSRVKVDGTVIMYWFM